MLSICQYSQFIVICDNDRCINSNQKAQYYLAQYLQEFLWQIDDGFSHKIFTVGSLEYYVLTVNFVALEQVDKQNN